MKPLLTLALCCVLALSAQAQIPSYVPTNGLVGWWPFNGNANDESGNGNHGTVNGATLAADRFGNAGKAYSFDGVDDAIQNNFMGYFGAISFSAWIKTSMVFGNYEHKGIVFSRSGMGMATGIIIQDTFQSGGIMMSGGVNIGGQISYGINKNILPNDGLWHLISSTHQVDYANSIQTCKLFFDGNLVANATFSDTASVKIIDPIFFGLDNISGYGNRNFLGEIDDIAIYNRALSAAEVQQLYLGNTSNNTAATTVPGKIHYQGLAVGANGKPIKNGTVGLRLSVLDSLPTGTTLYTETQSASTDAAGQFSIYLGGGTTTVGTFAGIPWANGNDKFLKVEMDAQGGTNYIPMGTTQLVSVPYAMAAGSLREGALLYGNNGQKYQITIDSSGPKWTLVPPAVAPFACGQSVTYAGESYPTVQIGTQCWFQKNVNAGTVVSGVNDQTNNGILEKYCYNNDTSNCTIYGGLYQWAEAVQYQNGASNTTSPSPAFSGNVQGICPTGWHVPSDGDWTIIENQIGGGSSAGLALKAVVMGGNNSSGFSAFAGGYRLPAGAMGIGIDTYFWTSSEFSVTGSLCRNLNLNNSYILRRPHDKSLGFSLRCIKD